MPIPEALGYPVAGRDRLFNRGIDIARPVRIAAGSGISARIRIAAGAVIIVRSGRGCRNDQSRDGSESQQRLPHGDTFPTLRRLQRRSLIKLNCVKEGDLSKALVWRPPRMSPSGHSRHFRDAGCGSALPLRTDIVSWTDYVGKVPEAEMIIILGLDREQSASKRARHLRLQRS